jgi:putative FmdB family regulatory protein
MPTYQYRCRECGEDLEVQQSFSDDPLTTCPRCEGSLRKVFSAVGISFKGSGFYKTDSRGGTSSTVPAASTDSGSSSSGSDSGPSSSSDSSSSKSDSSSASKTSTSSSDSKSSTAITS